MKPSRFLFLQFLSTTISLALSGCGGVATVSENGTLGTVSVQDFNAQQEINLKEQRLEMYKKLLPVAAREVVFQTFYKNGNADNLAELPDYSEPTKPQTNTDTKTVGLKTEGSRATKYKRSSLYTLILNDPSEDYLHYLTKYVFAKTPIPEKFNDHNLGPYEIKKPPASMVSGEYILNYLEEKQVAKGLIAKWFSRSKDGSFSMELVGRRGEYNASELDVKIALQTARGRAMLRDAGEELIRNTFVVVYDFERVDNSTKTGLFQYGLQSNITTRAYLYRLIWNEETAAKFYGEFWMDRTNRDEAKKKAFEQYNGFAMEYIGNVVIAENSSKSMLRHSKEQLATLEKETLVWRNVSFSQDEAAIQTALDLSLAELERKYEEFRAKFPLFSGSPIAAKVGKKEGIKEGDKFEVLEQRVLEDGTTYYERLGIIKVAKEQDIWNNTVQGDWFEERSQKEYTLFEGAEGRYGPGMLIRQIN